MSDRARERIAKGSCEATKHQHRKHCHDKDGGTSAPDSPVLQTSDQRVQENREKACNKQQQDNIAQPVEQLSGQVCCGDDCHRSHDCLQGNALGIGASPEPFRTGG